MRSSEGIAGSRMGAGLQQGAGEARPATRPHVDSWGGARSVPWVNSGIHCDKGSFPNPFHTGSFWEVIWNCFGSDMEPVWNGFGMLGWKELEPVAAAEQLERRR